MKRALRLVFGWTLLVTLLVGSAQAGPTTPGADKLGPDLQVRLGAQSPGQMTSVIVRFRDQADLSQVPTHPREARLDGVIGRLQSHADVSQGNVRSQLQTRQGEGRVASVTPFWIFNGMAVTATSDVIREIAALPEVLSITPDSVISAPAPLTAAGASPEPNVSVISAPAMWNLGYTGQGVVVANLDTGVDVTHPDLSTQWRGGSNSWYDPYGQHPTTPTDLNGHGTATMGVMVGRSAGGTAIGVAPNAQWIAAKIFNDAGSASLSAVHQSFQWVLNPSGNPAMHDAPHVVNDSWDFGTIGCNLEFQTDIQNLRAAGILPVFAAGNFGPNGGTSASPANNPGAFAVGATDNSDAIATWSSTGPNACSGAVFPSVVAPGVNVRTSDLHGLYMSASGTSLSAPHASGALALLLSAFPGLSADQQQSALTSSAVDLGPPGPDNLYGAGRINALGAYQRVASGGAAPTPAPPTATPTPLPPTATPSATPVPPTATRTPVPTSTSSGPPPTPTLPPASLLFGDSFESGNFAAWTSAVGPISVTSAAAMGRDGGRLGMQASIAGNTPGYVVDNHPNNETSYHARFYFNPNGTTTNSSQHDLFVGRNAANTPIFRVQYRRNSVGQYQMRAAALVSVGQSFTSWFSATNSAHAVELAWQSSTSGSLSLYIDGSLQQTLGGNTSAYQLKSVLLGPSGGLAAGMSGTEYFDAFVSTRTDYIGP
jgi:subtilisin family serine protease